MFRYNFSYKQNLRWAIWIMVKPCSFCIWAMAFTTWS